jgi:hypothetical protein
MAGGVNIARDRLIGLRPSAGHWVTLGELVYIGGRGRVGCLPQIRCWSIGSPEEQRSRSLAGRDERVSSGKQNSGASSGWRVEEGESLSVFQS